MSRQRTARLGWLLVLLGVLSIPATFGTLYVLVTSGVMWVAAALVSAGYQDRVRTVSLDEACDLIDAQGRAR